MLSIIILLSFKMRVDNAMLVCMSLNKEYSSCYFYASFIYVEGIAYSTISRMSYILELLLSLWAWIYSYAKWLNSSIA